jgi:hypothetical protein
LIPAENSSQMPESLDSADLFSLINEYPPMKATQTESLHQAIDLGSYGILK